MYRVPRASLLALLMALAAVAPASAAPDPASVYRSVASSTRPAATYSSLSPAQKRAFQIYLTPARVFEASLGSNARLRAPSIAAAASGCKDTGNVVGASNSLGMELWRYELYVTFCWNSGKITYSDARVKGYTYVAFWSWRQVSLTKSVAALLVPQRLTVSAQAEFKVCLFGDIGCVQYYYPWHTMRGYGEGRFSWQMGT